MTHEPLSNLGIACPTHAPKPGAFLHGDPKVLIGKFVKKSFKTDDENIKIEHMWVRVEQIVDGKLRGGLANDPVFCDSLYCGDEVEVAIDEIEDVCE